MVEILIHGNYYGNDEVRGFMSECQRIRNMKNYEVEKLRADGYMRYKHYIKAGAIYDEIIGYAEKNNVGNDFLGNVYHNKAVALAGNLQLDEAKEYFVKAYNLNNNDESLIEYFCVLAVTVDTATLQKEIKKRGLPENFLDDLMMEVGDSKEDVRELPIYNKVQKAVYNRLHGNLEDYDKRMNTILSELKDQFREQLV
jgi:tetratricopeptide (TPR) repeat protein